MRIVLLCLLVWSLSGCYSLQATRGHLSILMQRQSIDRLIADAGTPEPLRERLVLATEVRRFAESQLGLPAHGSYAHFVDLERDHVVWNVVVAPAFSVEPLTWCAPVAGCVAYRGYFSRRAAERFAERQRTRGHDVSILGVTAYSTLGWFRDPVLNTMLDDPLETAAVIIHELAHQRFYAKDDSAFSEAFATVVEAEGVRRWLRSRGDEAGLRLFELRLAARSERAGLVEETSGLLARLYASPLPVDAMTARKAALLEDLRQRLGRSQPLNNADLAASATYHERVPELQSALEAAGGDLEVFYQSVERWPAGER